MGNIIKHIRIKNFRSIREANIDCGDLSVFVGCNDVGKSNVLKALDFFFNSGDDFDFETNFCLGHKTSEKKAKEIVIELTISVPDGFREHGDLVWTRTWRRGGRLPDKYSKEFRNTSKVPTFLSNIIFEYIPAVKSDQYFRTLLQKLYKSLLDSVDGEVRSANGQYSQTLKEITRSLSDDIESSLGMKSYLQMPKDMSELFRDLLFQTESDEGEVPLRFRGDGIQARHIPVILKFIADKEMAKQKRAVRQSVIWGFEEPENGVELSACFEFAEQMHAYAKDIQLFITTHSPAFYNLGMCYADVTLYNTTICEGVSVYRRPENAEQLDAEMGLMPIVSKYVKEQADKMVSERALLEREVERLRRETDKVLIFTEGKTDVEYLKLAFERVPGYEELADRVRYCGCEDTQKMGDAQLYQTFEALAKSEDSNVKIFMFDRDNPHYIIGDEFERRGNRTYRFNIPVPDHRESGDLLCIEHYLTDEQLLTVDDNGRRVFFPREFRGTGISKDGVFSWKHAVPLTSPKYNPIEILDGASEAKRVYRVDDNADCPVNYALCKADLVEHIKNRDEGFDFDLSSFGKILDVIKKIVEDAEGPETN